jgi:hypothetical protein
VPWQPGGHFGTLPGAAGTTLPGIAPPPTEQAARAAGHGPAVPPVGAPIPHIPFDPGAAMRAGAMAPPGWPAPQPLDQGPSRWIKLAPYAIGAVALAAAVIVAGGSSLWPRSSGSDGSVRQAPSPALSGAERTGTGGPGAPRGREADAAADAALQAAERLLGPAAAAPLPGSAPATTGAARRPARPASAP